MRVSTERAVPDREFFRIGEVARVLGVPPSAIRYWKETFPSHIRPRKTQSLHHVFSRRDLAVLALIKHLVHVEGLSIRDTKDRLSELLAQHGGDVGFIELEQAPEGVREEVDNPGFLARLDEAKAALEQAREACNAAKARAAAAEAQRDRLIAERAALIAAIRRAVCEIAAEVERP